MELLKRSIEKIENKQDQEDLKSTFWSQESRNSFAKTLSCPKKTNINQ